MRHKGGSCHLSFRLVNLRACDTVADREERRQIDAETRSHPATPYTRPVRTAVTRVALQDSHMRTDRSPTSGIGWSEQRHGRGSNRGGKMRHSRVIANEQRGLRQYGCQGGQIAGLEDWDLIWGKKPGDRRHRRPIGRTGNHDSLVASIPRPVDHSCEKSRVGAFIQAPAPGVNRHKSLDRHIHSHSLQGFTRPCPPTRRNLQRRIEAHLPRGHPFNNFDETSGLVNSPQLTVEGRPKYDVSAQETTQCGAERSLRIGEEPDHPIAPSKPITPLGGRGWFTTEQRAAECSLQTERLSHFTGLLE